MQLENKHLSIYLSIYLSGIWPNTGIFAHIPGTDTSGDAPDIRPDNPAFLISGNRLDTGFYFPDIWPDTGY
jgi:hypothetical protein